MTLYIRMANHKSSSTTVFLIVIRPNPNHLQTSVILIPWKMGEPTGEGGKALEKTFPRFADDLMWWVEAANAQRQRKPAPY